MVVTELEPRTCARRANAGSLAFSERRSDGARYGTRGDTNIGDVFTLVHVCLLGHPTWGVRLIMRGPFAPSTLARGALAFAERDLEQHVGDDHESAADE